jgi:hypothetical protein
LKSSSDEFARNLRKTTLSKQEVSFAAEQTIREGSFQDRRELIPEGFMRTIHGSHDLETSPPG